MPSYLAVPLEVLGIGIVISYGIAFLIKIMLDALHAFGKKDTK
jgi:hypothetical protein